MSYRVVISKRAKRDHPVMDDRRWSEVRRAGRHQMDYPSQGRYACRTRRGRHHPGLMGTTSYLVEGTAERESLWSSSHGAGRISSRTQAKKNHDAQAYKKYVQEKDILTIGVAKDEAYQCYKDIEREIDLQRDKLVDVVATMMPCVVVMGGGRRSDDGD